MRLPLRLGLLLVLLVAACTARAGGGGGGGALDPDDVPAPLDGALLDVVDLKTYFDTPRGVARAVDGVSFSLERGKTLAIVGESGSGKSVTAQAIMGLIDRRLSVVTGHAWLEGRDLVAMSDDEVRHERGSSMAMIFQDPMSSLHPFYRIGAQLSEAVLVHQGHSASSGVRSRSHRLMKCAAFSELSLNSTPLLPRMPTLQPQMRAKPQTSVVP